MENENIRIVESVTLRKDDALAKWLVASTSEDLYSALVNTDDLEKKHQAIAQIQDILENSEEEFEIDSGCVEKILLGVDERRVQLAEYDLSRLTDMKHGGHWDLWSKPSEDCKSDEMVTFRWKNEKNREFRARNPLIDVDSSGTVAIDFGTKSTVVGFVSSVEKKGKLIRVGTGKVDREINKRDFENPTIMEFVDLETFLKDYKNGDSNISRPLTSMIDLLVSHPAQNSCNDNKNPTGFYKYFGRLKQWALQTMDECESVRDQRGMEMRLKKLIDCKEGDINPIEIYAYYLGCYINNMRKKIYLNYLLSYPAKYPQNVREKIRESFERGLKKSIPSEVFNREENTLQVRLSVSEPAAYAISALKEFGFYHQELDGNVYYGVFDFGGGTTDIDFGVWCKSKKSPTYNFDIEHFEEYEGGDPKLGGENLLDMLAYRIFEKNYKVMQNKRCCFPRVEEKGFGGDEVVARNTQDAQCNLTLLKRVYLRDFWERLDRFSEEANQGDNEQFFNIDKGLISIELIDRDGEPGVKVDLSVDKKDMEDFLRGKIENGVKVFFDLFQDVMKDPKRNKKDIECLHIFLGGNSSRSFLVKEAFEKKIAELKKKNENLKFELYPPLGTPEAEAKKIVGMIDKLDKSDVEDRIKKELKGLEQDLANVLGGKNIEKHIEDLAEKFNKINLEDIQEQKAIRKIISAIQNLVRGGEVEDISRDVTCKTGVVFGLLDGRPSAKIRVLPESGSKREAKFAFYLGDDDCGIFKQELSPDEVDIGENWYNLFPYANKKEFEIYYTTNPSKELEIDEVKSYTVVLPRSYGEKDCIRVQILGVNKIRVGVFDGEENKYTKDDEIELKL